MRTRLLNLALLLALAGLPPRVGFAGEVIDRVVVVVEDQLVTASDIRLETTLAVLDASPSPFWEPARLTPRERLVEAAILRHRAGNLDLYQADPDAIAQRLEKLRATFKNRREWSAFLQSFGLTEQTLLGQLQRRMLVERFLQRNMLVDPSDRSMWNITYAKLLDRWRADVRIREIAPLSPEDDASTSVDSASDASQP